MKLVSGPYSIPYNLAWPIEAREVAGCLRTIEEGRKCESCSRGNCMYTVQVLAAMKRRIDAKRGA